MPARPDSEGEEPVDEGHWVQQNLEAGNVSQVTIPSSAIVSSVVGLVPGDGPLHWALGPLKPLRLMKL